MRESPQNKRIKFLNKQRKRFEDNSKMRRRKNRKKMYRACENAGGRDNNQETAIRGSRERDLQSRIESEPEMDTGCGCGCITEDENTGEGD